jgi:anti-anti-sigma factor
MSLHPGGVNVEIHINNDDSGGVVAGLFGRLDANSAQSLQEAFRGMGEDSDKRNVVLDFAGVDYVSSAGLRELLILQKKILAAQGSLTIRNISGLVREVFDMTGFSTILKVV